MRHPVYRLATDGAGRAELRATGRRSWRRTVVIARSLCIFESIPAQGVAWHERRSFARLQALRLAPFASTGASAALRSRRLMLWSWDQTEVDEALAAAGLASVSVRTLAEPLLLPIPTASGPHPLAVAGGIDHLELDHGAVVSSRFEARPQGKERAAPDLLARPWANDLLQRSAAAGGLQPQRVAVYASWALAALSAAHLAYWGASLAALEQRREAQSGIPEDSGEELAAIARLKAGERTDRAWLIHHHRLTAGLQVRRLLDALEVPLEANRLVIKEFEARDDDLRVTLASVGGDIDLPGVLVALQSIPGIDGVRLRQNSDAQQASYSMRVTGFRQPVRAQGLLR
jgi:hypothetical protein